MKNLANLRILIIDDNPAIHQDFIKILTMDYPAENLASLDEKLFGKEKHPTIVLPHFQISTASQGEEGLACIKQALKEGKPYALAFVDVRMPPGWDGIETIKHIWEHDPDIQIVICTAYSDYSWEETTEKLGMRDSLLILKKPFDNMAVRQLATALTKKWQLMQGIRYRTEFLETQLEHQVTHDALTDLPNRVLLLDRIQQAISMTNRDKLMVGILFLDLDRFKLVNDSLSHSVGDKLLVCVANRLSGAIRNEDTIARLGGDKFLVVLPQLNNHKNAAKLASILLDSFKKPFIISNREILITSSIGISVYPQDGKNVDELLRNADLAMYFAKDSGANQFQFYSQSMNQEALSRFEKESELRCAVENNEFVLCYQPQFDVIKNKIVAVEALIRWQHPQKGMLLPLDFIPVAEETGLIVPVGEWVLRTACKQNKAWQDQGLPPIRMAVNVTTQQFRQLNFVDSIKAILQETGLKPEFLELEVTENVIVASFRVIEVIKRLKAMGVQIALDDFGTGNSSLNHLRKIPINRLKIDQSFIQNINLNRNDEVIIQAIIAMAHSLDLEVIAEGVETKRQLQFLQRKNCKDIQGFYMSKPLSAQECELLLRHNHNSGHSI